MTAPAASAANTTGASACWAAPVGLVVSTIEGALIRARAAGDQAPLDAAVAGLRAALAATLPG